jgi:prevent-host-death family protein
VSQPREVFYAVSKARNDLSGVIRRVHDREEVAIVTVDGQPVAKIVPHDDAGAPAHAKTVGGMTVDQIRKALDSTEGNPQLLRSMLELFI